MAKKTSAHNTNTSGIDDRLDKTSVVDGDTLKLRLDEARKAPPALVLLMGPGGLMGKQWPLESKELIVGRAPGCDVCVDEKSLSKRHARIVSIGERISVEDLESTNGTEVGGKKLTPHNPVFLNNDDRIKLGNVIFKFLSQGNIESVAVASSNDRSNIDGLTQIFNKAAITRNLEESFKKAKLTETDLALIVFDLDHFKKINDTYLHQGGDYVLREVASVVKNQLIRAGDMFGRYGGEEFVVILYGSSLQRACDVAERIRATIEKHNFYFGGNKIPVAVSLGVASIDVTLTTPEALFDKADRALYQSKSAGRNRVSTL